MREPLLHSARLAAITATLTAVLGVVAARLLSVRTTRPSGRLLDLLLLTAVALPGSVFAAGYNFTYNLWLANRLGLHLYQTSFHGHKRRVAVDGSIIAARTIGTLTPGAVVQLLVRPAATHIEPAEHRPGRGARLGGLSGVVTVVAYRGRG